MSAISPDLPVGYFGYRSDQGRLTWSEELYAIFGFEPGEVVPTLALMSSHLDPEDRPGWDAAIAAAASDGRPFSSWHRIVDARSRTKTVLTVVEGIAQRSDGMLRGWVTDVTEQLRRDRAQEVAAAVATSATTRAAIDQAKGVLMATMDIDEAQAFELLRWYSSYTNTKLRDIASMLLTNLADPDHAGAPPRQRLSAILTALSGGRRPPVPTRTQNWAAPQAPADQAGEVIQNIPDESMTRTLVHAIAAAGVSISIADATLPDWPLVYVNEAFEQLTGYSGGEMLGRNCRFLQGEQTDPAHPAAIRRALRAGEEIRLVMRNYRRDGTSFWNELHLSAVLGGSGVVTHYIGYQSDVSERVEREQQLERLAFSDPATSLPNTAAVVRHLDALAGAGASTDVLHLSLAGFTTDQGSTRSALIAAAERLGDVLPAGTMLAKLADDSFLAVLPEPDAGAADAVTAAFAAPLDTERGSLVLAVTITCTQWTGGTGNAGTLVESLRNRR